MKRALVMLLGAMLLTAGFAAFAECGDPGPFKGGEDGGPPPWQGTCSDEVMEVLGEGQCGGQCGEGEQHQYGRTDATLEGEGQCGGQCGEGEQHQYGR